MRGLHADDHEPAAGDRFGRRAALFAAAILFGVSAWGSGIATGSLEFVIYRLIGGFAVGAASIICPAYISEIAPARDRGRLATMQQMAIVLGLFFAFLSNYLLAGAAGGACVSGPSIEQLSPRERDVLRAIARGASNKEIARDLGIAETTVKIHVQHLLRKLDVSSRVQAAVFATARGLT